MAGRQDNMWSRRHICVRVSADVSKVSTDVRVFVLEHLSLDV